MKVINLLTTLVALSALTGCVSQTDLDKVNSENKRLQGEITKLKKGLDKCQNGAERTTAKIDQSLKEKNFEEAKSLINKLAKDHPEAKANTRFSKKLSWISKEIKKIEAKRKKDAEQERIRKNANNTGIWKVSYYVDDFGKPTKDGYIRNREKIYGTFNNSAVQGRELRVNFLLSKYTDADIQLYEYNGKNPVKGYTDKPYKVLVQDKKGKRYKLKGTLWKGSNRISLDKESSKSLHGVLKKGGTVEFVVKEEDSLSEYMFTIKNSDWYYNAYKKLHRIK